MSRLPRLFALFAAALILSPVLGADFLTQRASAATWGPLEVPPLWPLVGSSQKQVLREGAWEIWQDNRSLVGYMYNKDLSNGTWNVSLFLPASYDKVIQKLNLMTPPSDKYNWTQPAYVLMAEDVAFQLLEERHPAQNVRAKFTTSLKDAIRENSTRMNGVELLDNIVIGPDSPGSCGVTVKIVENYDRVLYCIVYPAVNLVQRVLLHQMYSLELLSDGDSDGDGYGDSWSSKFQNEVHRIKDWAEDLDQDQLQNLREFQWDTCPLPDLPFNLDFCASPKDWDADNWEDGEETYYWNDPTNDDLLTESAWGTVNRAGRDRDATLNFDDDLLFTNHDSDSDNDGLLDGDEWKFGSYPEFKDSDCANLQGPCDRPPQQRINIDPSQKIGQGDGMIDSVEYEYWTTIAADALGDADAIFRDFDGDGIANNLLDPDSDGDGIKDGQEVYCGLTQCTYPYDFDSDDDGLLDGADILVLYGDPRLDLFMRENIVWIRANGGFLFLGERQGNLNLNPMHWDTDNDCLPDAWEARYAKEGRPVSFGYGADFDGDQLSDGREYEFRIPGSVCSLPTHWGGVNPAKADTDGDGLTDYEEIEYVGSNPLLPDSDYDGLDDAREHRVLHTSATRADTDGDGLTDYQEVVTYSTRGPNPHYVNTDNPTGIASNDTLSDYEEIKLTGTKPADWDTDDDLIPDGWDANPHTFDEQPQQVNLTQRTGLRVGPEGYVTFRTDGYVDLIVQDPQTSEHRILNVFAHVNFVGKDAQAKPLNAKIELEAERLDDGATWAARFGLPKRLTASTSQSFQVTVVTQDGNANLAVGSYIGSATTFMDHLAWSPAPDPAGEWREFDHHFSDTQAPAGASAAASSALGIYSLSAQEIFAIFGHFDIYRIKPFAMQTVPQEFGTNASAIAISEILNMTIPLPLEEAYENLTATELPVNVTIFHDGFELVDVLEELGLYQTMSSGGSEYHRTARWIRTGVLKGWDWLTVEAVAQGASFVLGSDSQYAKGRMTGDIVAGILVYGDLRDVALGITQKDAIKGGLGALGIALTFVGPQADGPYGAFKSGVLLLKSINPTLALNLVNGGLALAKANGPNLLKELNSLTAITYRGIRNPDQAPALELLTEAVKDNPQRMAAIASAMDRNIAFAEDIRTLYPASAKDIINKLASSNDLYKQVKLDSLTDLAYVMDVIKTKSAASGQFPPWHAAEVMNALSNIPSTTVNIDGWWKTARSQALSSGDGWFGGIFEATQAARLKNSLYALHQELKVFTANGDEVFANADAVTLVNNKRFITEMKAGWAHATPGYLDQMSRQATVVVEMTRLDSQLWTKELHWVFSHTTPDLAYATKARELMNTHSGLSIKFFSGDGIPIHIP